MVVNKIKQALPARLRRKFPHYVLTRRVEEDVATLEASCKDFVPWQSIVEFVTKGLMENTNAKG